MTDDQREAFVNDLDELFAKHRDALETLDWSWDSHIEALIAGLVEVIRFDLSKQTHEGVIGCLESCIEHLRCAAFDYYASWK